MTEATTNAAPTARDLPLTFRTKLVYGSGEMVQALANGALNTFVFFYLTAVTGLSGAMVGAALFLSLLIDAVADPVIGSLSDTSQSPHGRRHPWMFAASLPVALGLGLIFMTPSGLSSGLTFAWVLASAIVLRVSMSLYGLPYMALGAEITDDYRERSSVVLFRMAFTVLGSFLALGIGFGLFLGGPEGLLKRDAYAPFGWTMGVLTALIGLFCAFGTLRLRERAHANGGGDGASVSGFLRELKEVFGNPSFRALFGAGFFVLAATGIWMTLQLHALTYFWRVPASVLQMAIIAIPVGNLLGVPIAGIVLARVEKRTALVGGVVLIAVVQLVPPLLKALGALDSLGSQGLSGVIVAASILLGLFLSVAVTAFQSMMADAADEHEHLFGARREGLYFAGLTFATKAAAGAGMLVAGVALDLIGFPAGGSGTLAPDAVDPGVARNLGLLTAIVPAAFTLTAAGIAAFYRLTQARHASILANLRGTRK